MPNPLNTLDRELRKWSDVREMLSGEDLDEETLLDTLDGETNLHEALLDIDASILEDEMQLAGLAEAKGAFSDRETRIKKARETKRNLILMAMDRAGIKTIKGACATLTVRETAPKLLIDDEAEIPADYWVAQDPKLDKRLVKEALDDGTEIEGARLDNGGISLTTRRK